MQSGKCLSFRGVLVLTHITRWNAVQFQWQNNHHTSFSLLHHLCLSLLNFLLRLTLTASRFVGVWTEDSRDRFTQNFADMNKNSSSRRLSGTRHLLQLHALCRRHPTTTGGDGHAYFSSTWAPLGSVPNVFVGRLLRLCGIGYTSLVHTNV